MLPLLGRALVLAVLGLVLVPTAGSAHNDLVGSAPRAGDTVSMATGRLALVFGDDLVGSAQVSVRDRGGSDVVVGEARVRGESVVATLDLRRPGLHEVTYRVLAQDGHVVVGGFRFEAVERRPAEEQAPSPPDDAPDAAAAPRADDGARGAPAQVGLPARTDDSPPAPLWWLGSVAVVGAAALGVRRLLSLRRS